MKETTHWRILARERKDKTEEELEKLPTDKFDFYMWYETYGGILYRLEPRKKYRFLGKVKQVKVARFECPKGGTIEVYDKQVYDICRDIGKKCNYKEIVRCW